MPNQDRPSETDSRTSENPPRRRLLRVLGTGTVGGTFSGRAAESVAAGDANAPPTTAAPPATLIPSGPTVGLETIAEGLTSPTDFATAPEDRERYFVTDQIGQVRVIEDGSLNEEPFLDLRDEVVDVGNHDFPDMPEDFDERGLLGIAFHPRFHANRRFYLRYSAPAPEVEPEKYDHWEMLAEFRTTADHRRGESGSKTTILKINKSGYIHNSGDVLFGPDGYLYVSMGDDAGSWHESREDWYTENTGGTGQDTTESLHGGIFRIDVDADAEPYGIPATNPLVGRSDHLPEYYAWGFRNPWGMSFDAGDLYVADVGESLAETVNRVEKGGNYGWNVKEGTHCFSTESRGEPRDDCPATTPDTVRGGEPLRDPLLQYPHQYDDELLGSAVVGGHVYRGQSIAPHEVAYIFGDWSAMSHGEPRGSLFMGLPPSRAPSVHPYNATRDLWQIYRLTVDEERFTTDEGAFNRYVTALGQDDQGELYVLTTKTPKIEDDTGAVHRIVPAESG